MLSKYGSTCKSITKIMAPQFSIRAISDGPAFFLEVESPREIMNVDLEVGSEAFGDGVDLEGWIEHHSVLWSHALEDDFENTGFAAFGQS